MWGQIMYHVAGILQDKVEKTNMILMKIMVYKTHTVMAIWATQPKTLLQNTLP
jgi:hypothetical protein